ncbi:MAG: hypothetical protein RR048_04085 [Oscillospiraceae bacterium]
MFNYKNSKESNSYRVILLEIIVSILFFAIFASVSTRVFVAAYRNNQHSIDLNVATNFCQDVMETFVSENGDIEKLCDEFGFSQGKSGYEAMFDENMNITNEDYTYKAIVSTSESNQISGSLVKINLKILSKKDEEIYSLTNEVYIPNSN